MVANKQNIDDLMELSTTYEAERRSYDRKLFIASLSLVMVTIAIAGSLAFAWDYYQNAINTVQDATSETRQMRVRLLNLEDKVDALARQTQLIQIDQQKTQTQLDNIQKQTHPTPGVKP